MTKPTMTEFKAMTQETAYSLLDDCCNARDAARESQADAIASHEKSEAEKTAAVAAEKAKLDAATAKHKDELEAEKANRAEELATLQQQIADRDQLLAIEKHDYAVRMDDLAKVNQQVADLQTKYDPQIKAEQEAAAQAEKQRQKAEWLAKAAEFNVDVIEKAK